MVAIRTVVAWSTALVARLIGRELGKPKRMEWREAERIVGAQDQGDYVLDLAGHCGRYEAEAPVLAELMTFAGTAAHGQNYAAFDRDAIAAQTRYRRWMRRANLGAFFTSILTAGAMALEIADYSIAVAAFSFGAVLAAAIGSAALFVLRNGKLLETWMNRRAMAETHRIEYFEGILARAVKLPPPAPILALEYFRRYQFEVQKSFLFNRAKQHEKSASVTVAIGATGAVFASLSSTFALFANEKLTIIPNDFQSAAGFFAIFGAALGAYAIGREQMTQDRRNAERYLRTHAALVGLATKLDDVREAVVAGRAEAACEFAAVVDDQISNEHRQWLDTAQAAEAALARIEMTITRSVDGRNTATSTGS